MFETETNSVSLNDLTMHSGQKNEMTQMTQMTQMTPMQGVERTPSFHFIHTSLMQCSDQVVPTMNSLPSMDVKVCSDQLSPQQCVTSPPQTINAQSLAEAQRVLMFQQPQPQSQLSPQLIDTPLHMRSQEQKVQFFAALGQTLTTIENSTAPVTEFQPQLPQPQQALQQALQRHSPVNVSQQPRPESIAINPGVLRQHSANTQERTAATQSAAFAASLSPACSPDPLCNPMQRTATKWSEKLLDMGTKELNAYLRSKNFSEEEKRDLKRERRRKKNRQYARDSRKRKRDRSDTLQQQQYSPQLLRS